MAGWWSHRSATAEDETPDALSKSCTCCLQAASSKAAFFRCVICRSIWHAQCCDAVAFSIIQKVSSTGSSGSGSDVHGIVYNRSDTDREHVAGFLWNVLRERLLATESSTTAVTMERLGSWRNISAQGLLDELFQFESVHKCCEVCMSFLMKSVAGEL